MSNETTKKIVEDIYGGRFVSLKDDVSKIISGKAVSVLEDMKSHVAKKFFSLGEDYNAPDATGTTSYSSIRDWGRDVAQQARGQRPTRSDQAIADVGRRAEPGTGRREAPIARPVARSAPAATPAQARSAARGDDMPNAPRNTAGPSEPGYEPPNAPTGRPTSVVGGRPAQPAPAARPAPAAGSQGVTGDELARTSGGAFANRANRMDQGLVNRTLGRSDLKAGSAEANLALRDYYRGQQRAGSQNQQSSDDNAVHGPSANRIRATAVSPEARAAADRLQRPERDAGEQEALRQQAPARSPEQLERQRRAAAAERDISAAAQRAADERDAADAADAAARQRNSGQAPGQAPGQER